MNHIKESSKPQKGGWCTGDYMCTCAVCGCSYLGDKRSYECYDCAEQVEKDYSGCKLYFVVPENVAQKYPGGTYIGIAHGSMMANLQWGLDPMFLRWMKHSFKKVICRAPEDKFEELLEEHSRKLAVTESKLDNMVVCAVFHPEHSKSRLLRKLELL